MRTISMGQSVLIAVIKREIDRMLSRRIYFVACIVLPLFSLFFMGTIFGDGQMENLPIGVVDGDNTVTSRQIIRMVKVDPTFRVTQYYANETEARTDVQKKNIYGYLSIPVGFEAKVMDGKEVALTYYYHYALLSVGSEIHGAFQSLLKNISVSPIVTHAVALGVGEGEIKSFLLPVTTQNHPLFNPDMDYSVYLTHPFFFVFLQVLLLLVTTYAIGSEGKFGTSFEWLQTAGGNMLIAIIGKLLPYTIIFIAMSIFANYIYFGIFDIPMDCGFWPLNLTSALFVLSTQALAVFLFSLFPALSIIISVVSMVGSLGATLSGVTFPVPHMYAPVYYASYLFPVRHFIEIGQTLLYGNYGYAYMWTNVVALLLFLSGGIFLYGLLYNYMYAPNVVRNAPVAVVDMSQTPLSRHYSRLLDATPQAQVLTNNADLQAAKKLMKQREVVGIVYIPEDFDGRVGRGEEAVYVMYSTTTAFLYYASMQEASAGAMLAVNDEVRPNQVVFLPQKDIQPIIRTSSIDVVGMALYNYTDGYGTYLIPAVLMVVIFQTLVMVISMLSGKEREESVSRMSLHGREETTAFRFFTSLGGGDNNENHRVDLSFSRMASIVLGKTSVYVLFYALFSVFLLGLLPLLFQLPHLAHPILIIQLMIPYIIATSFFALACSVFFSDSDAPLLMIAFFSVGLIFLSGVSYPLELMPWYWQWTHYLIPAAPGTLAFVKINSMGADMSGISQQYIILWMQCVGYFILACLAYRYNMKKALPIT